VPCESWWYVRRPGPRFVALPASAASFLTSYAKALAAGVATEGVVDLAELVVETLEGSLHTASFRRHRVAPEALTNGADERDASVWSPTSVDIEVLSAVIAHRLSRKRHCAEANEPTGRIPGG
jgi:hypothetical protein